MRHRLLFGLLLCLSLIGTDLFAQTVNDTCLGAIALSCGDVINGTTADATNVDQPADCGPTSVGAPGKWYSYMGNGFDLTIDLCTSGYDSKLHVYRGSCASLTCVTSEDDDFTVCGGNDPSITFTSMAGQMYYFYVNGFSGGTGNYTLSLVCDNCPTPEDLVITGSTDTSVSLNWTSGGLATASVVEYGPQGFTPGTGTQVIVGSPPVTVNGLSEKSGYEFYVKEVCGSDTSGLAGPVFLVTGCTVGDCVYDFKLYDSASDGWDGASVKVIQDVDTLGEITLDDGADTTIQIRLCRASTLELQWLSGSFDNETSFELVDAVGTTVYSFATGDAPFDLDIFLTRANTCPTCAPPNGLAATGITDSSATLSWSSGGSNGSFIVEYGLDGFALGTGTVVNGATSPLNVTGLMGTSNYDFYVTEVCTPSDTSDPTGPFSFQTKSANDLCVNATPLTCNTPTVGTTIGATLRPDLDGTSCGTSINTPGVWYSVIGNGTQFTASTCNNADYDTKISVFRGGCGSLFCLAGNDDATGCSGNTSLVNWLTLPDTMYYIFVHGFNGQTGNFSITVSTGLDLDLGPNRSVCVGDSDTIDASGMATASYLWSTSDTTSSIVVSPLITTNYSVTLTDANGCEASDTITIFANTVPTPSAGPDDTICAGAATLLSATGGNTYVWSTGETTASITVSPTTDTSYIVTATNANGCSNADTVNIFVLPAPTADAGPDDSICLGEQSMLTATGSGTYAWSTGASTASITVAPSVTTTYMVTVTGANGCTDVDSVTVVVLPTPVPNLVDVSICAGSSTILDAGNAGSTYNWSTGASTQSIPVNSSGTYIVTVTDPSGCFIVDTSVVTIGSSLSVNLSDQTICPGGSASFNAGNPGATYLWSTGSVKQVLTVSVAGTYSVTVTDGNGCTGTDAATLTVLPAPPADAGSTALLCLGDTTTLTATGGSTYQWSTGSSNASIQVSPTADTYYTVTVTDGNGCTAKDSVLVDVFIQPNLNVFRDTTICLGENVILVAVGGSTYQWSNGPTTPTNNVSPTSTTTYSVTATNAAGCTADSSVTVSISSPPASAGVDTMICAGDTIFIGDPDVVRVQLINEDFNDCVRPFGWQTLNLNGGPAFVFDSVGYSNSTIDGSCMAVFDDDALGSGPPYSDVYLISPGFNAGGFDTLIFEADINYQNLSNDDTFAIDIFDGTQWVNLVTWTEDHPPGGLGNDVSEHVVIDIVQYAHPNNRIRFNYDDAQTFAWYVHIDNVLVTGVPAQVYSYSWSPTAGLDDPTSGNPLASPSVSTDYILTVTDSLGCTAMDTVSITVNPVPLVNLSGLGSAEFCANAPEVTLTGSPSGGAFTGSGTNGAIFDPATADSTYNEVVYTYTDGNGCTAADTQAVTVIPLPPVDYFGLPFNSCVTDSPFTLIGFPAGGTFSGDVINDSIFAPNVLGIGNYTITYDYTDTTGCADTITKPIEVTPGLNIQFVTGAQYCEFDSGAYPLAANPPGGSFTGPGVVNDTFYPAMAGLGDHDIIYEVSPSAAYIVDTNCTFGLLSSPNQTAISLPDADEEISAAIPIGFPFQFFGRTFNFVKVSTNGFVTFDTVATRPDFTNDMIPDNAGGVNNINNLVALMWDDLQTNLVTYFQTGVAPNRRFVVYFIDANHLGNTSRKVEGQVILFEGSNVVEIHCANCFADAAGASATQGLENEDGTDAVATPGRNNTNWSAFNDCVRFFPTFCPGQDTLKANVASLPTVSAGADTAICAGDTATLTATGGVDFTWSNGANMATTTVSPNFTTDYQVTVTDANGCTNYDTVRVSFNTPPTVDGGMDTAVCIGESVDFTATGASTYVWSTGDATADVTVTILNNSAYGVTGTDGNGCTASDLVFVTANPLPVVSLSDPTICPGSSTTLDAGNAGSAFSWSNGATSQTISVNSAGSFAVTVTDGLGCSNSDTAMVTIGNALTVSITDQTFCDGDSAILDAGNPGATFNWSTGATTQTITVKTAGLYEVTVTDANGCSGQGFSQVTVYALPPLNLPDPTICVGSSTVLDAGSTPTGYTWSTGDLTRSITVSIPGTYAVTVFDANGCVNSDSAVVTIGNSLNVGLNDAAFCDGDSVTLDANNPNSTYIWSTGATTQTITVGTVGTYSVTVSDANSCTGIDTAMVTNNSNPTADAGADVDICFGDTEVLTANGGGTYVWSNGATTANTNVTPASTTDYTVTVTDVNGCTDEDTVTVSVNPLPTADAGTDGEICFGDSFNATATGGVSYSWSTGDNTASITQMPDADTSYVVTVTDANGCMDADTVAVVVNPLPVLSIAAVADSVSCIGAPAFPLSGTPAGGTFSGAGVTAGQFDPSSVGLGAHPITYTYTDANNCTNSVTDTIRVDYCPGIAELPLFGEVKVYPNPFDDRVIVELELAEGGNLHINLVDITGKVILTEAHQAIKGKNKYIVQTGSDLSVGLYFIELVKDGKTMPLKLTKIR